MSFIPVESLEPEDRWEVNGGFSLHQWGLGIMLEYLSWGWIQFTIRLGPFYFDVWVAP
mgnify:FL=1